MTKKKTTDPSPVPERKNNPVPEETPEISAVPADGEDDVLEEGAVNADAAQSAATSNARLKAMMNQNFIEYASYVIRDRAIPDIDDGFKPVQRRILWAMYLADDGSYHKVAGVIGDTMKFHPHGDASIGDALVYLANKELYIDPQGNYGSIITGKPAAAPRLRAARPRLPLRRTAAAAGCTGRDAPVEVLDDARRSALAVLPRARRDARL